MVITIAAGRPDRRRRDLENIATKAVLDLLTAHGVIQDDADVVKAAASWDAAGIVRVTIESLMEIADTTV